MLSYDKHLVSAGTWFMFLCLIESTMRDFVTLKEGDDDMRRRYNEAYGRKDHPLDFAQKRLELGRCTFGNIKERFLCLWPKWKNCQRVHEAIERLVIYRNGFAHPQVQWGRSYLLYTPAESAWGKINKYMRCPKCEQFRKDCKCRHVDAMKPHTLIFPFLDKNFTDQLDGDIRTVELDCLKPTAKCLGVEYLGIEWP